MLKQPQSSFWGFSSCEDMLCHPTTIPSMSCEAMGSLWILFSRKFHVFWVSSIINVYKRLLWNVFLEHCRSTPHLQSHKQTAHSQTSIQVYFVNTHMFWRDCARKHSAYRWKPVKHKKKIRQQNTNNHSNHCMEFLIQKLAKAKTWLPAYTLRWCNNAHDRFVSHLLLACKK